MKHFCPAIRHGSSTRLGLFGKKPSVRGGFTLVEMMVSISLVMLIMLLFATVFDMVSRTMSAQKGLAENDQKARTLTIIMKEDLEHRTFRRVVPFYPGQDTGRQPGPFYTPGERRGYFSISENNPDDPTDDVLAFTAFWFDDPIAGRATPLSDLLIQDGNGGWVLANQNQPEFDDGLPPQAYPDGSPQLDLNTGLQITNRVGLSRTVEIVYFLRHGNLYRRVLLVREPYDDQGTGRVQPDALPGDYPSTPNPNFRFWRDFDYSAYRDFFINPGPKFHGSGSMNNDSQTPGLHAVDGNGDGLDEATDVKVPAVLGIPFFRFGHSPSLGFGIPCEFVGQENDQFIGRFLQRETAHFAFGYPGFIPVPFDPFINTNLSIDFDTGMVSQFGNQFFRRGEDILMSNVHEFDIKVWDDYDEDLNQDGTLQVAIEDVNGNNQLDRLHRFVDLGYGNLNLPLADQFGKDEDDDVPNPRGYYHRLEVKNPVNINDPGGYSPINRFRYDTWHPFDDDSDPSTLPPFGFPPFRPLHPFFGDDREPGTFQDDDLEGVPNDSGPLDDPDDPGEQGWLGSDDEVPLKAIQITVRFFDVESDQMRQLTLIHTLTD